MKELERYLKKRQGAGGEGQAGKKLFIPYLALSDPDWRLSGEIIDVLFGLGADTIELGLPFTDPVADGPVLQQSFSRILQNGFKLNDFFDFLEKTHHRYSQKPLLVMGYANLFYRYGFPKIFKRLGSMGVGGLVIPDLPFEEKKVRPELKGASLPLIDFITPTTPEKKIKKICSQAEGFLYLVSTKGVTGRSQFDQRIRVISKKIRRLTDTPVVVGFGIKAKEHIKTLGEFADGFIVGSLIHEIIEKNMDQKKKIPRKLEKALGAVLEDI